ncbi:hypothetical protein RBK84_00090, partial [Pseudomonas aeruginosa]|uniref:hypothetical protein n=1 Tax=Pseudomonas aeruginosa TaxID=287 RepID=UPI0027D4085B
LSLQLLNNTTPNQTQQTQYTAEETIYVDTSWTSPSCLLKLQIAPAHSTNPGNTLGLIRALKQHPDQSGKPA